MSELMGEKCVTANEKSCCNFAMRAYFELLKVFIFLLQLAFFLIFVA